MMKKSLVILTSVLLLFATLPVSAFAATYYYSKDGLGYEITDGAATLVDFDRYALPLDVVIPAEVDGCPVTAIGDSALHNCNTIVSLVIPDSVETIGTHAFMYCYRLESVKLSNSITDIPYSAFHSCTSLRSITIPDSVRLIRSNAFYDTALTEIVIPDNVWEIEASAFGYCWELTTAYIGKGTYSISDQGIFAYGPGMKEIYVDEENPYYCDVDGVLFTKDKKELVYYPMAKGDIYSIPEGTERIGRFAFQQCWSMPEITIPDSVTRIEAYAFERCEQLATVYLGSGLRQVDKGAFSQCYALTDVYYNGTEEDVLNLSFDDSNDDLLNATWHYGTALFSKDVGHSVMDTQTGNGLAFRFEVEVEGVAVVNGNKADFTNATVQYAGQECPVLGMGAVVTNEDWIGNIDYTLGLVGVESTIDIPVVYLTDLEQDSCAFAVRIINIPENALNRTVYARPYLLIEVDGEEEIAVYGYVNSATCAEYM